jgi:hypothetical protein
MALLLEQSEQKALQQQRQWWRRVPSSQNVNAFPQRTHSSSSFSTVAVISDEFLTNVKIKAYTDKLTRASRTNNIFDHSAPIEKSLRGQILCEEIR